ncbi:VOC family protein [Litoribrevibacter euphylliae]|uniref:VOC family protein n=1 Tax=Litoribrevibacter euphylliae TaxID=1834034 RepID=A0ABV7HFC7_9GAMM
MRLNHVLIMTTDLSEMTTFFCQALALTVGDRPAFEFDGVWLYDDQNLPCIHLADRSDINAHQAEYLRQPKGSNLHSGLDTIDHLAFSSKDYPTLIRRLDQHQIPYIERDIPESEEHQVFVFGPDELKVEIVFSRD